MFYAKLLLKDWAAQIASHSATPDALMKKLSAQITGGWKELIFSDVILQHDRTEEKSVLRDKIYKESCRFVFNRRVRN